MLDYFFSLTPSPACLLEFASLVRPEPLTATGDVLIMRPPWAIHCEIAHSRKNWRIVVKCLN